MFGGKLLKLNLVYLFIGIEYWFFWDIFYGFFIDYKMVGVCDDEFVYVYI